MEPSHIFTGVIIALIAAAMIFIEKRPLSQVAMVVAFMVLTWVVYWVMFQTAPPAPGSAG